MVRCAGWVELILLLFGDVVFPELRVAVFDYRCLCLGVTPPLPLSRGEVWDGAFLLEMGMLCGEDSPLERGSRGVLW